MRKFLASPLGSDGLFTLFKYNIGVCLVLFTGLEIWRPYFFLTDDNLSGLWPLLIEIGRHLKSGQSPFVSEYIFGGGYDLSRDIAAPFWHPFYLVPSLLGDTPGRYAILDVTALLFFLLTAAGFTLLAGAMVREFNAQLPVIYIVFYTASFMFSSYILMVGSSWLQFLGNQSALPWLTLGILHRRLLTGTALVVIFSLHQFFSSYLPSTFFTGIFLSFFAVGIAVIRRSPVAVLSWIFGNIITVLVSSPYLLHVLDGFAHTTRITGLSIEETSKYALPATLYPFSFFLGNWTGLLASRVGDAVLQNDVIPYPSTLMACAAAWCLVPALLNFRRWRQIEILFAFLIVFLVMLTIRPQPLAVVMHHLPFLRSMRWPFRECLQLLFFFHLFLLTQAEMAPRRAGAVAAIFSAALFLLPLPFARVPSLNGLEPDREEVLSGKAEAFWAKARTNLKPGDVYATVIDDALWQRGRTEIPYSVMGTADFPAAYEVRCISGYAPTAPSDEVPLKTPTGLWFGAFETDQVPLILAERPDLKLIMLEGIDPLRISLWDHGKRIDLTRDLVR